MAKIDTEQIIRHVIGHCSKTMLYDIFKVTPSLTIKGAGGRGRVEQRPPCRDEAGALRL